MRDTRESVVEISYAGKTQGMISKLESRKGGTGRGERLARLRHGIFEIEIPFDSGLARVVFLLHS